MSVAWKPHIGQRKAVKFLLEHAAAALFASPGVGKTSAVYAAFKVLKKKGLANRMLVVAPLRPCWLVWPAEQQKWTDFKDLKVAVLHGPKKNEALYSDADVCITNFESLDWILGATRTKSSSGRVSITCDVAAFRKHGFDVLVIDELTAMKSTQSGRHKAIKAVRHTFGRIWGLTGTPAPNGLVDLFGQVLVLDGGRSLGPYATHFRQKYFLPGYDGFSWVLRKGAEAEIYERIRPLVLRLAAEDYVDMPDLVENVIRFDLPPAARKVYDALEDDLIAKVGDRTVIASNAAAASVKLRQVVNGGVYLDEETRAVVGKLVSRAGTREWAPLHDEKTELLAGLVEELQGSPLLVGYDFKHDLERIKAKFGKNVPVLGVGSTKQDLEIEAAWNRGEVPLLFGHPQSIGHGLNLQGAGNAVAWYGLPWARDLYDQFVGRVRRQGSKHQTVFCHIFLARDSIDETVYWALKGKARVQDALLLALKERVKKKRVA
jgi:SNF2 family DNA or RNA helicase